MRILKNARFYYGCEPVTEDVLNSEVKYFECFAEENGETVEVYIRYAGYENIWCDKKANFYDVTVAPKTQKYNYKTDIEAANISQIRIDGMYIEGIECTYSVEWDVLTKLVKASTDVCLRVKLIEDLAASKNGGRLEYRFLHDKKSKEDIKFYEFDKFIIKVAEIKGNRIIAEKPIPYLGKTFFAFS